MMTKAKERIGAKLNIEISQYYQTHKNVISEIINQEYQSDFYAFQRAELLMRGC